MNNIADIYATFAGPIDNQTSNGFFDFFGRATQDKIQRIHLLIQSSGGVIGDAIAIYNFILGCPIEIITYNCGAVDSSAVIVYLSGTTRYVAETASFTIHSSSWTSQGPIPLNKQMLLDRSNSLSMEDVRTRSILEKSIRISPAEWNDIDIKELIFTADKAIKCGLSTNIGIFEPIIGSTVLNIIRK